MRFKMNWVTVLIIIIFFPLGCILAIRDWLIDEIDASIK